MRKSKWLLGVTAAMLLTTGCRGSVCSQLSDSFADLEIKARSCDPSFVLSINEARCDQSIDQCTANDKDQLEKQVDCLAAVKACVVGQEELFTTAVSQCSRTKYPISSGCQAAVFQ